ncbi:MAG: NAD(+)/NADH kinase [bacterium]|nr:NAD(+)/NADH kinase [bacterium]MDD5756543.1 NAD(+)/NADH kinase [bacterium]
MKIWLAFNPNKEKAKLAVKKLQKYFSRKKIKVINGQQPKNILGEDDLVVALGGDGTLLRVARAIAGCNVPVLGVNLGGLGFLTEVTWQEVYKTLDRILQGDITVEERMMLQAEVWRGKKKLGSYLALNDVVVNSSREARVVSLDLAIDNKPVANYIADGLIVATPTGSTAYTLSAGGPIVYPDMDLIIVAPICPHMLTLRPLIVAAEKNIAITMKTNHQIGNVTMDGQIAVPVKLNDVIVVKKAAEKFLLITSPYKNYFEVLRTKLKWSERA